VAGAKLVLGSNGAKTFAVTDAGAPVVRVGGDGADVFGATAAGGTFTGKGGRDQFHFSAGDGDVTVTDFASGTDKLVFLGFERADIATAKATQGGVSGLRVTYDGDSDVFLPASPDSLPPT
jgi:hypothetical protein